MQDISVSTLIDMTIGLASGHNEHERFNKLLDAIRKAIRCDSVALLSVQGDTLVPLAIQGLTRDTLGRRFKIDEHPRFKAICDAKAVVRFDADSPLPDPFDTLLVDYEGDLPMHACMGLPLIYADALLGVLALDSLTPNVFDNIPKRSLDALSAIVASTLKVTMTVNQLERQAKQTQQKLEELNQDVWEREGGEIIGSSPKMISLKDDINVVAPSDFNILINGETGVGKELVARSLHQLSNRRKQPLVYVNCAAIPENLLESELFGHVKGAFTGADKSRLGKFALADGGTLFLDEIGELPLAAQSKILRALQNNEIQPVGQDSVEVIDVRILAATNRDLPQEVAEGRFRADLYHRLSVYPIPVPPLRERQGDVVLLAGYFLEQARRKLGLVQIKLASDAQTLLTRYNWPGNVRELEHVLNRAALKAKARGEHGQWVTVSPSDLGELNPVSLLHPEEAAVGTSERMPIESTQGIREATNDYQRQLITQALTEAEFNWAQAARKLKTDRANLTRLAKRLGITVTKHHKISSH
ncbi:nitric oxide reductase transcriptional regulator NorR [Vibrio ostreicida]|uniref:Nitric oxide reductase transcriptional regulator NorR n=1 Tax=Vibrio ostreicida TaxID=526588 RepID=A0ABT8BZ27_9VIBR|nr:nitric oxide reductase transcriptional regulator NorR [Vibrio ostreicida]MDN3612416.1 nitric oxide reductase transcriptional regulator NorR [Vibrio ostreicida]NPD09815.1 nitric oxide reductase transcriptional regulator NorR [Vibrio ostreicida]